MDVWDSEGAALSIFREAGIDPADPPGPHALAEALMGRGAIAYARIREDGHFSPYGARPRIYLRSGMSELREAWTIFHELAERHVFGEQDEAIEVACNRIAACLRAPRAAFRWLLEDVGPENLQELAERSGTSQTSAAMRVAEVLDVPSVIVTPATVYVRGPEWGWPDEAELRRLSRARAVPGELRKVRLDDAKGRVLLTAK